MCRPSVAEAVHEADVHGRRQRLAGLQQRGDLVLVDFDTEISIRSVNVRFGDQDQAWPAWTPEPAMLLDLGHCVEGLSQDVCGVTVVGDCLQNGLVGVLEQPGHFGGELRHNWILRRCGSKSKLP